jgi:hypothetical protein
MAHFDLTRHTVMNNKHKNILKVEFIIFCFAFKFVFVLFLWWFLYFQKQLLCNPFKIINHILTYIYSSILVDKASYVLFIHPPTLSIMEHSPMKGNNIACFSNLNSWLLVPSFKGILVLSIGTLLKEWLH